MNLIFSFLISVLIGLVALLLYYIGYKISIKLDELFSKNSGIRFELGGLLFGLFIIGDLITASNIILFSKIVLFSVAATILSATIPGLIILSFSKMPDNIKEKKRLVVGCSALLSASISVIIILVFPEKVPSWADKVTVFSGITLTPSGLLQIFL